MFHQMMITKLNKTWQQYLQITQFQSKPLSTISGVPRFFERKTAYSQNQICSVENFFQVVKIGHHFESVSLLSILGPKNIVISKKGLHFDSVSDFFQGGSWHDGPPSSILCFEFNKHKFSMRKQCS